MIRLYIAQYLKVIGLVKSTNKSLKYKVICSIYDCVKLATLFSMIYTILDNLVRQYMHTYIYKLNG